MSDDYKIFSIVPDSTKEEALNPTSNLVGQAFRGLAHIVLDPLVRHNIVKDAEMEDFANKIRNKTNEVPNENRDDSKIGLAYKAMEDSVYQLNEETLREMFANLISASVDNRKNQHVRSSFSSILKDLSSDDANLFRIIFKESVVPTGSIRVHNSKTLQGTEFIENVILLSDYEIHKPSSLDILNRFGLITIKTNSGLVAEKYAKRYERYENSSTFKSIEEQLPRKTETIELDSAILIKGSITLTTTGEDLGKIVIT